LESRRPPPWTTWNWQDVSVQGARTQAFNTSR
jgi:hypothetical protein